ncbi:neuroserpin-like [Amphibalanus amphitrite]|uniref:neuroserpin-like n=1 Tax=Amphibalanus amphitrite TaxID=1232801 RepID=UPI001C8FFF98|nr:neuroserpin-like [Amphibalanus amphitrite]
MTARGLRHGSTWLLLAFSVTTAFGAVPNGLDLKLVKELTKDLGKNQAVSPFVVSTLMSQVWLSAGGSARREITSALGVTQPAPESFLTAYQSAINYISTPANSSHITTSVFSKMYVREGWPIKQSFIDLLTTYYGASGVSYFSYAKEAADEINSDVANVTNNRIPSLVSEKQLERTSLVLVSALYFKGNWKDAFQPDGKGSFLTINGEKSVDMMKLTETNFPYTNMGSYDAMSLPYADDQYCMIIIRPVNRSMDAVAALRDSFDQIDVDGLVERMYAPFGTMDIKMPRFTLRSSYTLNEALEQTGIREIFHSPDLSGLYEQRNGIYVGSVIHKVFMEVNENGTEAAGAGAVLYIWESVPLNPPDEFLVDRPFFALVYNKLHKINLFTAFIASP